MITQPDITQHTAHLLFLFDTTESELKLHREGRLSDEQHTTMLAKRRKELMTAVSGGGLLVIVCFTVFFLMFAQGDLFSDFGWTQIVVIGLLVIFPTYLTISLIRQSWAYKAMQTHNSVASVTGEGKLFERHYRGVHVYGIKINGQTFQLTHDQYRALIDGMSYRVYYVPPQKETPIAIEPSAS